MNIYRKRIPAFILIFSLFLPALTSCSAKKNSSPPSEASTSKTWKTETSEETAAASQATHENIGREALFQADEEKTVLDFLKAQNEDPSITLHEYKKGVDKSILASYSSGSADRTIALLYPEENETEAVLSDNNSYQILQFKTRNSFTLLQTSVSFENESYPVYPQKLCFTRDTSDKFKILTTPYINSIYEDAPLFHTISFGKSDYASTEITSLSIQDGSFRVEQKISREQGFQTVPLTSLSYDSYRECLVLHIDCHDSDLRLSDFISDTYIKEVFIAYAEEGISFEIYPTDEWNGKYAAQEVLSSNDAASPFAPYSREACSYTICTEISLNPEPQNTE